jgi:hypothetical protein
VFGLDEVFDTLLVDTLLVDTLLVFPVLRDSSP